MTDESMGALVAFDRARLDEDEQAAMRAASLCACHPAASSWRFDDYLTDGRIEIANDPHPQVKRKLGRRWNSSYDGLFAAAHIARHDPARILRDVEADRKLIAEYERVTREIADGTLPSWESDTDEQTRELYLRRRMGYLEGLEAALLFRALPHADHEDYDESWRP